MPDVIDFPPVFTESAETIRARILADINAGLEPSDPSFLDTTPGGFASDLLGGIVLELERVWDAIGQEMVAAGMVAYAWDDYLDDQGEALGVDRKDAAFASGVVRFTGSEGSVVPVGAEVAVPSAVEEDPDAEPIIFRTTAAGTVTAVGFVELPVVADEPGSAGNVGPGVISVPNSSVDGISAVTNPQATGGGADVESDEQLRQRILLALSQPAGAGTRADLERWALTDPGVGHVTVEPLFAGPGTARVTITDPDNNPVGPATVDRVQTLIDPPVAVTELTAEVTLPADPLPVITTDGFDAADGRVVIGGNIVRYIGRTDTELTGTTGGERTFPAGTPVKQIGHGAGKAAISHHIVITTAATAVIPVAATIVPEPGYGLTAAAGVDLTASITAAIATYIDGLSPGEDVILGRVEAAIFSVRGVHDVTAVTVDGQPENRIVSPLEVAQTGDVTLN